MDGYETYHEIHAFDVSDDDSDDDDDELPVRVKYSVILQEEDDFMDE
jgi:hypothetical protein